MRLNYTPSEQSCSWKLSEENQEYLHSISHPRFICLFSYSCQSTQIINSVVNKQWADLLKTLTTIKGLLLQQSLHSHACPCITLFYCRFNYETCWMSLLRILIHKVIQNIHIKKPHSKEFHISINYLPCAQTGDLKYKSLKNMRGGRVD